MAIAVACNSGGGGSLAVALAVVVGAVIMATVGWYCRAQLGMRWSLLHRVRVEEYARALFVHLDVERTPAL